MSMNLTPEKALKKGIEAHKAGSAQDAIKFYSCVLKADPKNTVANHNMGAIALNLGKINEDIIR